MDRIELIAWAFLLLRCDSKASRALVEPRAVVNAGHLAFRSGLMIWMSRKSFSLSVTTVQP